MTETGPDGPPELTRTILQLVALGALIGASFWIIRPFLPSILWAVTGAIATWPLLLRMQSWLGGKRSLAVVLMSVVLLVTLIAPFYFAIATITGNIEQITQWAQSFAKLSVPRPPAWLSG